MAYEQRDNSGSAFVNQKKERETHADLTGSAMVDGTEYWLNVWRKTDRNGNEYLSVGFRKKEQRTGGGGGGGGFRREQPQSHGYSGAAKPAGNQQRWDDEPQDSIPF